MKTIKQKEKFFNKISEQLEFDIMDYIQDDELDLFDDIVHETSHAVETVYGYQIYGDKKIEEEFEKYAYLKSLIDMKKDGHI